ncbi:MAG: DUF2283 domain-containing protein [Acidimicrobiia bacterium]|nr:DUF2283 domain-containing protein [Acidimicrobiia bacterium]MYF83833.1 DUF2283 domain-containing protein [Acidimicrobiia bacterium]
MIFSYDYDADALYIEITDSPVARTRQFDEGTMVDLDESGEVVGIEVLRPARAWPLKVIRASYELPDGDARILDSLWAQDPPRPYPFTRPPAFVS